MYFYVVFVFLCCVHLAAMICSFATGLRTNSQQFLQLFAAGSLWLVYRLLTP